MKNTRLAAIGTTCINLIPAYPASGILPPSRPAEGSISRRSCIEGGLQVGYMSRHARRVYLRLATPTD
jgi:hypothetical protein